jgi:hypothetical protein
MVGEKAPLNGSSAGGSNGHDSGLADRADQRRAWCEILKLVRDEAETARQHFLVYLVDIAIEHAVSLERSGRIGQAERN